MDQSRASRAKLKLSWVEFDFSRVNYKSGQAILLTSHSCCELFIDYFFVNLVLWVTHELWVRKNVIFSCNKFHLLMMNTKKNNEIVGKKFHFLAMRWETSRASTIWVESSLNLLMRAKLKSNNLILNFFLVDLKWTTSLYKKYDMLLNFFEMW